MYIFTITFVDRPGFLDLININIKNILRRFSIKKT